MKKTNEEHLIQKEAMEKNLISMAREIEKLRGEQMRARGLGTSLRVFISLNLIVHS